jgi:hypothetical protein
MVGFTAGDMVSFVPFWSCAKEGISRCAAHMFSVCMTYTMIFCASGSPNKSLHRNAGWTVSFIRFEFWFHKVFLSGVGELATLDSRAERFVFLRAF